MAERPESRKEKRTSSKRQAEPNGPAAESSGTSPRRRPATSWQESLRDVSPYLGLGMQLGLSLVFFVGIGYVLDRWLGTTPWLTIAGALVGMAAGFIHLVRTSKKMSANSTARSEASSSSSGEGRAKSPR